MKKRACLIPDDGKKVPTYRELQQRCERLTTWAKAFLDARENQRFDEYRLIAREFQAALAVDITEALAQGKTVVITGGGGGGGTMDTRYIKQIEQPPTQQRLLKDCEVKRFHAEQRCDRLESELNRRDEQEAAAMDKMVKELQAQIADRKQLQQRCERLLALLKEARAFLLMFAPTAQTDDIVRRIAAAEQEGK
jgi:tRNA A37 N6-isopentenylltransferase MiaA